MSVIVNTNNNNNDNNFQEKKKITIEIDDSETKPNELLTFLRVVNWIIFQPTNQPNNRTNPMIIMYASHTVEIDKFLPTINQPTT